MRVTAARRSLALIAFVRLRGRGQEFARADVLTLCVFRLGEPLRHHMVWHPLSSSGSRSGLHPERAVRLPKEPHHPTTRFVLRPCRLKLSRVPNRGAFRRIDPAHASPRGQEWEMYAQLIVVRVSPRAHPFRRRNRPPITVWAVPVNYPSAAASPERPSAANGKMRLSSFCNRLVVKSTQRITQLSASGSHPPSERSQTLPHVTRTSFGAWPTPGTD
jgi:hypothetical protein